MLPHSAPRLLAHLPVGQQDPAVVIPRVSTVESVQRVATSGGLAMCIPASVCQDAQLMDQIVRAARTHKLLVCCCPTSAADVQMCANLGVELYLLDLTIDHECTAVLAAVQSTQKAVLLLATMDQRCQVAAIIQSVDSTTTVGWLLPCAAETAGVLEQLKCLQREWLNLVVGISGCADPAVCIGAMAVGASVVVPSEELDDAALDGLLLGARSISLALHQ